MKICFITTSFPRSKDDQAGIFISRIVKALSEQSVEGTVLAPHEHGAAERDMFWNWDVLRVRYGIFSEGKLAYGSGIMPNLRKNPLLILQVPALLLCLALKAFKYGKSCDLFHAHWLPSAAPALIAAKITGKKFVTTVRGEDLKLLKMPWISMLLKWTVRKSQAITTISDDFKRELGLLFPDKEIVLIRNGVDRVFEDKEEILALQKHFGVAGCKYFIHASRLIPLKRIEIILRLLAGIEYPDIRLLVCGSIDDGSYLSSLRDEIKTLGLEGRVNFTGPIKPDQYRQLLCGASLYLSASEYEGRPNAVLEALAQGIPAVLSDIPAHSSLVRHGLNGLLFNENNLPEAAGSISQILSNSELYSEISSQAAASTADFSWQKCALQYFELYKHIIEADAA